MKNLISYLYDIDLEDVLKCDSGYLLKSLNSDYLLYSVEEKRKIEYINFIIKNINDHFFFSYKFIYNKLGSLYSNIEDKLYVLIEIEKDYENDVDITEMLSFYDECYKLIPVGSFKFNWDFLWENKIDYLLLNMSNNKVNNKKVRSYFNYYIGVAENALMYLKNLRGLQASNRYEGAVFTHRRINSPNKKIDFYNPAVFGFDLEVRDIAEYIKSRYYTGEDYLNDLEYYLKIRKPNIYSASLLYVRILYPSIFLDYYEQGSKESIMPFDIDNYEYFVKKTYELISSYVKIEKIPWL